MTMSAYSKASRVELVHGLAHYSKWLIHSVQIFSLHVSGFGPSPLVNKSWVFVCVCVVLVVGQMLYLEKIVLNVLRIRERNRTFLNKREFRNPCVTLVLRELHWH